MKVSSSKDKAWQPRTLEITFESQKEMDTFAALFNYSPFCDAAETISGSGIDPDKIRRQLEELGGSCCAEHQAIAVHVTNWFKQYNPKLI